jgi:hypothetical protein
MSQKKRRHVPSMDWDRAKAAAVEATHSLDSLVFKPKPELRSLSADQRMRYVVEVDERTGAVSVQRIGVVPAASK